MNADTSRPTTVDRLAELTELVGGLAHELRNPLSTVMINLRLLAEDLSDTEKNTDDVRRRALQKVAVLQNEAQRLQSLFDEFLSLTTSGSIEREPVDLRQTVSRLVEFFEPLAAAHGIELLVDHDPALTTINADDKLLRQALLNILVNAQQAMPDGGVITLSTRIEGDSVVLRVVDQGVGIAEQDRERILRPFFSTKPDGNGLGMSIVRRIIEDHGGHMKLSSELGRGTVVSLVLPRQASCTPRTERARLTSAPGPIE